MDARINSIQGIVGNFQNLNRLKFEMLKVKLCIGGINRMHFSFSSQALAQDLCTWGHFSISNGRNLHHESL